MARQVSPTDATEKVATVCGMRNAVFHRETVWNGMDQNRCGLLQSFFFFFSSGLDPDQTNVSCALY